MDILLSADEVTARVETLADRIAPEIADGTIVVCLLTGALWFTADLTRALSRKGKRLAFDALWLSGYGDAHVHSGETRVRAGLQRSVKGAEVLILDDVLDSGLSLKGAVEIVRAAGAGRILTCVFARKPWPKPRIEPDFVGWEAPARYLAGYGMDDAGRLRELPAVVALD